MAPTPRLIKEYHVFLASPGDMDQERQAVRDFFKEYNTTTASQRDLSFIVIDWENYSSVGVGRPQELITSQTLERYRDSLALVIGLMGQRFGSPSGTHESGTEEEFEWALTNYQEHGFPEVKWFFRKVEEFKAPSDPKRLLEAVEQWDKVRAFRERLDQEKRLFFGEFTDLTDFQSMLRRDVSLWLNDPKQPWGQTQTQTQEEQAPTPNTPTSPTQETLPSLATAQRETLLRRYVDHLVTRNRHLQLQGIRSGGQLVPIELEQIYITLKASRIRNLAAEEEWLAEEQQLVPGERHKRDQHLAHAETVFIKVEEALAEHTHLVVLGDPGSGKTTLLRYLALCYARGYAGGAKLVQQRLRLPEDGRLPILLALRNLGAYLKVHHPVDDGIEGVGRLLAFLHEYLQGEHIEVPKNFFDADLEAGRLVLLFDGMDEVGDFTLRRRVARLVENVATSYPDCRVVVTSRIVGYSGAARVGGEFATTTIQDFDLADVQAFLTHWHQLVNVSLMGQNDTAEHTAARQSQELMKAIRANPRVRELAINPLMLTVIALVHRDRVKLPERRAELYAEAVEVLLGKWDEARGVDDSLILGDRAFDMGDRRLLLQELALAMHAAGQKEIETDMLQQQVKATFTSITSDPRAAERASERFLQVVQERTGLLVEAGLGVYRFSHLTFQEYLAAVEVAEREDHIRYTLTHTDDPFWREVILLEAGYLSTKSRTKTTQLVQAIAESQKEPEPFHNMVLAAECIRDVGPTRIIGDFTPDFVQQLREELRQAIPDEQTSRRTRKKVSVTNNREVARQRRIAAAKALSRIESGTFGLSEQYWSMPHGEPEWVTVPAGEFWMGSDKKDEEALESERPIHRLVVAEFQIARAPVTNAQYQLYVQATGTTPARDWKDGEPPKDKLTHPVVYVSWEDARAYCQWLSQVTGKPVRLPTEAEWEKAARGHADKRIYPWRDEFDVAKCNTSELGLEETSPVGMFASGVSPYGCLDMSGNVWEWVQDWFDEEYYKQGPDRNLNGPDKGKRRSVRGGSWLGSQWSARVAARRGGPPGDVDVRIGFRCASS